MSYRNRRQHRSERTFYSQRELNGARHHRDRMNSQLKREGRTAYTTLWPCGCGARGGCIGGHIIDQSPKPFSTAELRLGKSCVKCFRDLTKTNRSERWNFEGWCGRCADKAAYQIRMSFRL